MNAAKAGFISLTLILLLGEVTAYEIGNLTLLVTNINGDLLPASDQNGAFVCEDGMQVDRSNENMLLLSICFISTATIKQGGIGRVSWTEIVNNRTLPSFNSLYGKPSSTSASITDGVGTAAVILEAHHLWQHSDNQTIYFIDNMRSIRMVNRQSENVTTLICGSCPANDIEGMVVDETNTTANRMFLSIKDDGIYRYSIADGSLLKLLDKSLYSQNIPIGGFNLLLDRDSNVMYQKVIQGVNTYNLSAEENGLQTFYFGNGNSDGTRVNIFSTGSVQNPTVADAYAVNKITGDSELFIRGTSASLTLSPDKTVLMMSLHSDGNIFFYHIENGTLEPLCNSSNAAGVSEGDYDSCSFRVLRSSVWLNGDYIISSDYDDSGTGKAVFRLFRFELPQPTTPTTPTTPATTTTTRDNHGLEIGLSVGAVGLVVVGVCVWLGVRKMKGKPLCCWCQGGDVSAPV